MTTINFPSLGHFGAEVFEGPRGPDEPEPRSFDDNRKNAEVLFLVSMAVVYGAGDRREQIGAILHLMMAARVAFGR